MSENIIEGSTVKRLERSRSDRMLAGVCGGLARYVGIHPAFYRVGFVVLTLLGGSGILIYLAAALVIPLEGNEDSYAARVLRERRDRPWPLVGLALLGIAGAVLLSRASLWPHGDVAWVLLLLFGGVILWVTRRSETVAPAAPAKEDARRVGRVLRRIAIAIGVLFALLIAAIGIFAATFHVHAGRGVGDRAYVVNGAGDLHRTYSLGIGHLSVDLSSVQFPAGVTYVDARVDVGKLDVVVPPNVAVQVHGDAQLGKMELFGESSDGRNVDNTVVTTGTRVLALDAHVGVGDLVVTRAVR
jgi:phage shock protein C